MRALVRLEVPGSVSRWCGPRVSAEVIKQDIRTQISDDIDVTVDAIDAELEDQLRAEAASMTDPEIIETFRRLNWGWSKEILARDIAKRLELKLEGIEEANDILVEGIDHANTTSGHGEMRPSTHLAFKRMETAHARLSDVDPTRENDD